jgi:hypothetical protein
MAIMSSLVDEMLDCLEVRKVKELLPHEQTISPNLKRLKEAMLNIGQVVDPIIVDKKTGLVIDGNHRQKVLEIIECPYAAVQTVDYMREDITVDTWFPSVCLKPEEIFQLDSIKHEPVDYEAGRQALADLKAPFMIMSGDKCELLNPGAYKIKEMVEEQNYILSLLEKKDVAYISQQEVGSHKCEGHSILFRRSYTKDEIIKTAQDHSPLPPKSTRHLVPGRIIRLNMRIGWLHRSQEEAQVEMKRMLSSRVYSGNVRKYYEPVTVIY